MATGRRRRSGRRRRRSAARVNPNGRSTSWYFEYGTSTTYGSRTSSRSAGSGTATARCRRDGREPQPGVTYHFRLVASSSLGTTRGADATFVTTGAPLGRHRPGQLRDAVADVRAGQRHRNPRGLPTTWWFEYGRTPATASGRSRRLDRRLGRRRVGALLRGSHPASAGTTALVAQSAGGTSAGPTPRSRRRRGRSTRRSARALHDRRHAGGRCDPRDDAVAT